MFFLGEDKTILFFFFEANSFFALMMKYLELFKKYLVFLIGLNCFLVDEWMLEGALCWKPFRDIRNFSLTEGLFWGSRLLENRIP